MLDAEAYAIGGTIAAHPAFGHGNNGAIMNGGNGRPHRAGARIGGSFS
jgi:hypothetical protein